MHIAHMRAQVFGHGRGIAAVELRHRADEDRSSGVETFVAFEGLAGFEAFPACWTVVGRGALHHVVRQLVGDEFRLEAGKYSS